MSSRRRFGGRLVLAGMASVVALVVTGCGDGGNGGDEVASAEGGRTSAKASTSSSGELAEYVEAQRKWVTCLRGEGLDAPDPDAKGKVELGDQSKWKRDPKALKAQEKCADLSVPVPESVEKAQQPELTKEEIRKNQQYAECMQEHGAPDFPDTGADGHFRDVTWDSTSAGAKRATRACASIIGIPDDAPTPQG
ncbi:hypothetical protein ACWD4L_14220 [Streptomyces sp. NPDC002596]|uniref:hypothetical protein n=1 Tax=unclassified Streptomyces TaxID=2593676 RepID=UPI0022594099|nr:MULTISPECIES: hypothetical protein [unclassified Streptomyces]MCX4533823.1 hypothetical protein [Streptomyces sp. NBC_01669]WSA00785.1 hypothetical protein OHA79_24830 [Streptomyces sp. NBC_00841]